MQISSSRPRIAIIGGGLVGLATARALRARFPDAQLTILEKEPHLGAHQSTHNSGVLHAGLYYKTGSLRAQLVVRGLRMMTAYCRENGIAHEVCGKIVVATEASEIPRLQTLFDRGAANGLEGLRWLSGDEAREREPAVRAEAAVLVPQEGIVDYEGVVTSLGRELEAQGSEIRTGTSVTEIDRSNGEWRIGLNVGSQRRAARDAVTADFVVGAAGLHSDRIARLAGLTTQSRIVPFRGEYFTIRPDRSSLVRHLIYPVPDPRFPFLGVHFTRMIGGGVECGPNAVLALSREGYRRGTINPRDAMDTALFPGLWRFAARNVRVAAFEIRRSLSRRVFAESLQRLVPAIREDDLVPGPAGVRAQAMRRDGTLADDFEFAEGPGSIHVVNAPSPAATASLAIGEEIARRVNL